MTASHLRLLICTTFLAVAGPVWATSVIPPSFDQLVNRSDYVIHGRVAEVESRWMKANKQMAIFTFVTFEVLETVSGEHPETVKLQLLGGTVEGEEMVIQGAPTFEVGQEYMVFVEGNGTQFFPLVAMMYGSYPIKKDAATGQKLVMRSNGQILRSTEAVSEPMDRHETDPSRTEGKAKTIPLTLEQFKSRIRTVEPEGKRDAQLD